MRKNRILLLSALLMLLIAVLPALAQGGTLAYGTGITGTITAASPLNVYAFNGATGELVTVQVIGLTPDLSPNISLNGPNQQQLGVSTPDPFNPGSVEVTRRLMTDGVHTIIVSAGNTTGDFVLRLDGSPPVATSELAIDTETESEIIPGADPLAFTILADPENLLNLRIATTTPDFPFAAVLRTETGQVRAAVNGDNVQPIVLTLQPGDITYEVEIRPVNPASSGTLQIALTGSESPTGAATPTTETPDSDDSGPPPPLTTEEAGSESETTGCQISNDGSEGINVRMGSGATFNIITVLQPDETLPADGQSNGWYRVILADDARGWVSADVVVATGPCESLPTVSYLETPEAALSETATTPATTTVITVTPTATRTTQNTPTPTSTGQTGQLEATTGAPTPTSTWTPTATTTSSSQSQITATSTATFTPTATSQQATATFTPSYTPTTPPAAQVAPEDPRFNTSLDIPLDNTVSVLDFVSYPGGDTEDRVRYSVTGMNPNSALSGGRANLVIAVSCFGEGTANVEFFTGGQTYSCGQTLVDREVTADSDTGSIVITAVSGSETYVQWVLTGTATRIN